MKLQQIGIFVGIAAGVVAIWAYLKGSGQQSLVTYPNTQASGQPTYQNPASVWNIAVPSPAPSPVSIYGGNPPPLPPTPAYQNYNFSPANLLGMTPQGAAVTPVATDNPGGSQTQKNVASGQPANAQPACCGGGSCGCGGCGVGGTYQDGNMGACVVASPKEQVLSGTGAQYTNLQNNIASFAARSAFPNTQAIPNPASASPIGLAKQASSQPSTTVPAQQAGGPWQVAGIVNATRSVAGSSPNPTEPPTIAPATLIAAQAAKGSAAIWQILNGGPTPALF
jgi:hypothetical protein